MLLLKGKPRDRPNYRRVSSACVACKLIDHLGGPTVSVKLDSALLEWLPDMTPREGKEDPHLKIRHQSCFIRRSGDEMRRNMLKAVIEKVCTACSVWLFLYHLNLLSSSEKPLVRPLKSVFATLLPPRTYR